MIMTTKSCSAEDMLLSRGADPIHLRTVAQRQAKNLYVADVNNETRGCFVQGTMNFILLASLYHFSTDSAYPLLFTCSHEHRRITWLR